MTDTNEELEGTEIELEEQPPQPFDPSKISIDTKPLSMDACLRRIIQGTIMLAPDFQRNEVWNNVQKSRLIESLLLRIPIPMFYVSADENGNLAVVDGLQRLSTIRSFILGDRFMETKNPEDRGHGFPLENLEFWNQAYAGKCFNDLPIQMQNRLLETQFTFTIINPGTPEDVKRNVFKRLNTGGEPLTPQEIRHALYLGTSSNLLKELSQSENFLRATTYSIRSNRMEDRELILRFLAFSIRLPADYYRNSDMDSFLSDTMILINNFDNLDSRPVKKITSDTPSKLIIKNVDVLKRKFELAMERAIVLFGRHAFRRSIGDRRRTQVNKALFETWGVLLSNISETEFANVLKNEEEFLKAYEKHIDDIGFQYLFSRDSLKYSAVESRFETLEKLLYQYSK